MVACGGAWQGPGEAKGAGPPRKTVAKAYHFLYPRASSFPLPLAPLPQPLETAPIPSLVESFCNNLRVSPCPHLHQPLDDNTRTRIRRYLHPTPKTTTNISLGWPS